MKKRLLNITAEHLSKMLRHVLSPAFLVILAGAGLMWYTSRLSIVYDTELTMNLRIDGQKYRITAIVSGRGTALLAQQLSLKRPLNISLDELSSRNSRTTIGALIIAPASLQKAINDRDGELKVVEITDAPEFVPIVKEEKDERKK